MSWTNPSYNEAMEEYSYYKNKYYNAANDRNKSIKLSDGYSEQRSAANSKMNELIQLKLNFERRIEGIERIIGMLTGGGCVPSSISKTVNTVKGADSSFKKEIILTGGSGEASVFNAFNVKTVEGEAHSAAALQDYKRELQELETKVNELKRQIADLSSQIASLTSKINSCISTQGALKNTMYQCAYEMNHYRKFL